MNSPSKLSKALVSTALLVLLATLSGCITSNDVLLSSMTTPIRAGKYQVQYLVDGKWTTFGAGSLALVRGKYMWAENREAASLLNWNPAGSGFTLVDTGSRYFIIVVATADLRNPIWAGNYIYGVARRAEGSLLYDFPSCLDLLVSQGFSDPEIRRIEPHECQYSSKASLTRALTAYARRTVMWKRLAPSSH